MYFRHPRHVLREHLLLRARLADLYLHEEIARFRRGPDIGGGHAVGEQRNRRAPGVTAGERGAAVGRNHFIERIKAVFSREKHPHGVVHGDERVERVGGAEPRIVRDLLSVLPHLRPEPVVQLHRRREGPPLDQPQRVLSHRKHYRIAAAFGVLREHFGVRPERTLRAEADAVQTGRGTHIGGNKPQFRKPAALEAERPLHRLAFEPARRLCDRDLLESARSRDRGAGLRHGCDARHDDRRTCGLDEFAPVCFQTNTPFGR